MDGSEAESIINEVAPLVGAWIEIIGILSIPLNGFVAPLVGAWIEIGETIQDRPDIQVAPLVGAWIEILYLLPKSHYLQRRSPCGSVD